MKVAIIGGGTMQHISNHLSLCAPAYGGTAKRLVKIFKNKTSKWVDLYLSRMAGGDSFETNEELRNLVLELKKDPQTHIVFMTAAVCDFEVDGIMEEEGEDGYRVSHLLEMDEVRNSRLSSDKSYELYLEKADKIISNIRRGDGGRKDIFLVAFKTTVGDADEIQYQKGLKLLKSNSCNLVLVNDLTRGTNMLVVPEEAKYDLGNDRQEALEKLVDVVIQRSSLHFSRTNVVDLDAARKMKSSFRVRECDRLIDLNHEKVPQTFKEVLEYCIKNGAYTPSKSTGKSVGHYAFSRYWEDMEMTDWDGRQVCMGKPFYMYSSIRKRNYEEKVQLVLVQESAVLVAHGEKPSAGVRTQFEIIKNNQWECDSLIHFHRRLKDEFIDSFPSAPQLPFECGSSECGLNTFNNMKEVEDGIFAVYLEKHGPNILFRNSMDSSKVIEFIDKYFDLNRRVD